MNFGVFELYGDRALADALDISIKMILSIPLTDLLAYQKVASNTSCISDLISFFPNVFGKYSMETGLK